MSTLTRPKRPKVREENCDENEIVAPAIDNALLDFSAFDQLQLSVETDEQEPSEGLPQGSTEPDAENQNKAVEQPSESVGRTEDSLKEYAVEIEEEEEVLVDTKLTSTVENSNESADMRKEDGITQSTNDVMMTDQSEVGRTAASAPSWMEMSDTKDSSEVSSAMKESISIAQDRSDVIGTRAAEAPPWMGTTNAQQQSEMVDMLTVTLEPTAPLAPTKSMTDSATVLTTSQSFEPQLYPSAPGKEDVQISSGTRLGPIVALSDDDRLNRYNTPLLETEKRRGEAFNGDTFHSDHPLVPLVELYRCSRIELSTITKKLQEASLQCEAFSASAWKIIRSPMDFHGTCRDGRDVIASQIQESAELDNASVSQLRDALESRRNLLLDSNIALKYESRMARFQIQAFLARVLEVKSLENITSDSTTSFKETYESLQHQNDSTELRCCIDVLFTFLRGGYSDSGFMLEVRQWLEQLVWALYRICTLDDHRYILHHLVRCRSGDGHVMEKLIEVPDYQDWTDGIVDHLISSIYILVHRFPAALSFKLSGREDATSISSGWFSIDESGKTKASTIEDGQLSPDDYVDLLERFPIDSLLSHILFSAGNTLNRADGTHATGWRKRNHQMLNSSTEHILDALAFFDFMFNVLKETAAHSNKGQDQFQKRVTGVVLQIASALCKFWGNASKDDPRRQTPLPGDSRRRIDVEQAEIDRLFHNIIEWLFNKELWLFLPQMKYNTLSVPTLWRAFNSLFALGKVLIDKYSFRESWDVAMRSGPFREDFTDKLVKQSQQNTIHLLRCLSHLALAGFDSDNESQDNFVAGHERVQFLEAVLVELFEATCVSHKTRELLLRDGRDLFGTVAKRYPPAISILFKLVNIKANELGKVIVYLFADMPFDKWVPSLADIHLLRGWLLEPLGSPKHLGAKLVFESANWNLQSISWEVQHLAGLVLVAAFAKFAPKEVQNRFSRQLSSLLPPTSEEEFGNWCWGNLFKLQLFSGPGVALEALVADLPIHQTLLQPICAFFALNCTELGRKPEPFMTRGLPMLLDMTKSGHFEAVMLVLHKVIPHLVGSTRDFGISVSKPFKEIISLIVRADKTVLSFAESLSVRFVSHVHEDHFIAVAVAHVSKSGNQSLTLAEYWLKAIFTVNEWYLDHVCRRLVDLIIVAIFRSPDGRQLIQSLLIHERREAKKVVDELFHKQRQSSWVPNWIASETPPDPPSFADGDASTAETLRAWMNWLRRGGAMPMTESIPLDNVCAWLIYESLCSETAMETDVRNGVGSMIMTTRKSLTDAAKHYGRRAESFTVFRWAQFCGMLHPDHPLLPLFWQSFFALFFASVSISGPAPTRKCFGPRFFASGGGQTTVLPRLVTRLKFLREHQRELVASGPADASTSIHRQLESLFGAMVRWIEEDRLHTADIQSEMIPAEFEMLRLTNVLTDGPWSILGGIRGLWIDLVSPAAFVLERGDNKKVMTSWDLISSQFDSSENNAANSHSRASRVHASSESQPKRTQLMRHTNRIVIDRYIIDAIEQADDFIIRLAEQFAIIESMAEKYATRSTALKMLDDDYITALPGLYSNGVLSFSQKVGCKPLFGTCAGAVEVRYQILQQYTTESVQSTLHQNRDAFDNLVGELTIGGSTFQTAFQIQFALRELMQRLQSVNNSNALENIRQTAIKAYFFLASRVDSKTTSFPLTRNLLFTSIRNLGELCIKGKSQHQRDLLEVLHKTSNPDLFLGVFEPHLDVESFQTMYIDAANNCHNVKDLNSLFECFEVSKWLENDRKGISARSDIVGVLAKSMSDLVTDNIVKGPFQSIHKYHVENLVKVLGFRFPEQFGGVIKALLDKAVLGKTTQDTWNLCLEYLYSQASKQLLLGTQCLQTSEWVGAYFRDLRDSSNDGLIMSGVGYIPFIGLFFDLLLSTVAGDSSNILLKEVFNAYVQLFAPFVAGGQKGSSPWSEADLYASATARTLLGILVKNIKQLQYAQSLVLSAVLDMYVKTFHPNNQSHVLAVIHEALLELSWEQLDLAADLPVIKSMNRILVSGPASGTVAFFAEILVKQSWEAIATKLAELNSIDQEEIQKALFQLVLMVAMDRQAIEVTGFDRMWEALCDFNWELLDKTLVSYMCGWFAMRADPTTVLATHAPACVGLRLILSAVGLSNYEKSNSTQSSGRSFTDFSTSEYLQKQITTVRTYIGMLKSSKTASSTWIPSLVSIFRGITIIYGGRVGPIGVPISASESSAALLSTLFPILNEATEPETLLPIFYQFLDEAPGFSLLVIRSCRIIHNQTAIVLLAEYAIRRFFEHFDVPLTAENGYGWNYILPELLIPEVRYTEFISSALDVSGWFTLHVHVLQRLSHCSSLEEEQAIADAIFSWIGSASTSTSDNIVLLLAKATQLAHFQIQQGCSKTRLIVGLNAVLNCLLKLCEERETSGFFGAIGMGAKKKTDPRLRFMCTVLALVLCQALIDMGLNDFDIVKKNLESYSGKLTSSLNNKFTKIEQLAKFNVEMLISDIPSRPVTSIFQFNSWLAKSCKILFPEVRHLRIISP